MPSSLPALRQSGPLIDAAIDRGADTPLKIHGWFWKGEDGRITGCARRASVKLLAHDINLLAYHLPLDAHRTLAIIAARRSPRLAGGGRFGEQDVAWFRPPTGRRRPPANWRSRSPQGWARCRTDRRPGTVGGAHRLVTGGAWGYFECRRSRIGVASPMSVGEISEPTMHLRASRGSPIWPPVTMPPNAMASRRWPGTWRRSSGLIASSSISTTPSEQESLWNLFFRRRQFARRCRQRRTLSDPPRLLRRRKYADHAREMGAHEQANGREPPFSSLSRPMPWCLVATSPIRRLPPTFSTRSSSSLRSARRRQPPAGAAPTLSWSARRWPVSSATLSASTRRAATLQARAKENGHPWDMGKGFDASAPTGELHPVSEIGHRQQGAIWLKVNGEIRQRGDLAAMSWMVAEVIANLSGFVRPPR